MEELIQNDGWKDLSTTIINFSSDTYSNPFRHKYVIKLSNQVMRNQEIILIFPNYPTKNYKIIRTSDYRKLSTLQKDINERLALSVREGFVFYVAVGNQIYALDGIIGRIYLIWAECINRKTINQQVPDVEESVPIFIETNGKYEYRSIYIAGSKECINCKDCELTEPIGPSLFCLEEDPRKEKLKSVKVITNSKADEIARTIISRDLVSMDLEEPPFPSSEE